MSKTKVSTIHEENKSLKRQLNVLTYKRLGMVYSAKGLRNAITKARVEGNAEKVRRCTAIVSGLTSSIRINKLQSSTLRSALR